jgi:hypothetical protein
MTDISLLTEKKGAHASKEMGTFNRGIPPALETGNSVASDRAQGSTRHVLTLIHDQ